MATQDTETLPEQPSSAQPARRLRNSLIGLAIVVVFVVALLLAVPGLSGVAHALEHASAGWIGIAIALEYLSCLGYVLLFLLVFYRGPTRLTARLAWSELAANSLLPAGGIGGLGLGAWVLRQRGVPTWRIAERSTAVFFLTSAVSIAALVLVGVGLGSGVLAGPHDFLRTYLPALVGLAAIALTLGGAAWAHRFAEHSQRRIARLLAPIAQGVQTTLTILRHRDWRLLGAVGYWAFDVATLVAAFAAVGHVPPVGGVVMGYLIGQQAGALPIPGGIGAVNGGLLGALVLYHAPITTTAAALLIYRTIALWLPALLGTIAFLLLRRGLDEPLLLKPPLPYDTAAPPDQGGSVS